jgi:hypothetical protein
MYGYGIPEETSNEHLQIIQYLKEANQLAMEHLKPDPHPKQHFPPPKKNPEIRSGLEIPDQNLEHRADLENFANEHRNHPLEHQLYLLFPWPTPIQLQARKWGQRHLAS